LLADYNITVASINDVDSLMNYLNDEYKENHILSNNKELFLHEFKDRESLNFILAKDKSDNIIGCMGYIKSNNLEKPDLWTSIWSVSKKSSNPTTGLKLFEYLRNKIPHRYLLAAGVNPETLIFYKKFGIKTGTLKQYYIINDTISNYQIAKVKLKGRLMPNLIDIHSNKDISLIPNITKLKKGFNLTDSSIPYKDYSYLQKKYFTNPFQNYDTFCVSEDEKYSSVFMTREVEINNAKALLMVDYFGDENDIPFISLYLYHLIVERKFEYVTFLEHGLSDDIMDNSKFLKLNHQNDSIIIPIYFSQFVQKNIEIGYFADIIEKDYWIFKADGDQDRPN
jgi:hypothetical protein